MWTSHPDSFPIDLVFHLQFECCRIFRRRTKTNMMWQTTQKMMP